MDQIITSTLKNRRRRSLGLRLLICYLKKSNIKLEDNVHTWTCLLVQSLQIT
ncbi:GM19496 [Drosophila sechellia]|uniref:GM19496 n=1 Tax=Drosophila sechellia TaxID=7238 RepID=B4IKT3_DROSE|nr:GM19496 [Drosophila sechellia]